jgi:hypothetical protein
MSVSHSPKAEDAKEDPGNIICCQLPSNTCHVNQSKRAGADKLNVVVNGCMCGLQVSTLTPGASYTTRYCVSLRDGQCDGQCDRSGRGGSESALAQAFDLFVCIRWNRVGKMKFQNFEISEIWPLEMKFEIGLEILKLN